MRTFRSTLSALALFALLAGTATAQYKWRDPDGSVHYSDQPPPAGVAARQLPPPLLPPSGKAAGAPANPAPVSRPVEPARRAAPAAGKAESENDRALREHACDGMQTELRTLQSGMRVAYVDPNGERRYVSDEERAKRVAALKVDVEALCSAH